MDVMLWKRRRTSTAKSLPGASQPHPFIIFYSHGGGGMATSYRPGPILARELGIRGVCEQHRETGNAQERSTHLPQQHP